MAGAGSAAAHASTELDCGAIASPRSVDLGTLATDTRHVAMRAGETLRFAFQGGTGPIGILALVEGPGAPQMLLVGPSGSGASFTAERSGAFGFQFTKEGVDAARFTMTCTPRREADAGRASGPASDALLGDATEIDSASLAQALQLEEPDGAMADLAPSELRRIGVPPAAGITLASPTSMAPTQMKLRWLDQRYHPGGPNGPQIDPGASGLEIGVDYKLKSALTVGALAQVNPATEMVLGGQRSRLDQGWMMGPVAKLELVPGLVLDARAAWGEGESGPDEATVAAAQRRLVSARVANKQAFGPWRFTPSVSLNYLEGAPRGLAMTDVQEHAGGGRIHWGPELAYRSDLTSAAFIEPRAAVAGFWDFADLSHLGGADADAGMRLKAEAGVTLGMRNGSKLQALGAVEEGDGTMPDVWSGRLQLSVPLK